MHKTGTLELLKLLAILVLAYCLVFIPHLNYPYPIHHDEWMHMAYAEAILHEGSITFADPFYGQVIKDIGNNMEVGFHVLLATFQMVTNMAWPTMFTYLPGVIFMITVLSVYILAQREGFGLEAAFFTCLIPTSVGILGPAFLVPVALGLLFIPLSLFMAFNIKSWHGYLSLFLLSSLLFLIHPPTAIILGVVLLPYIVLNLISNYKHSLAVVIAVIGPFLLSIPWTWKTMISTISLLFESQSLSPHVNLPPLLQTYGYLPIAISLIGIVYLALRGKKNDVNLIFGLLALLVMLIAFYRFHMGLPILYERGLTIMLPLLSILAGAGLFWVRSIKLSGKFTAKTPSFLSRNAGTMLCLLLAGITLLFTVPGRINTTYYHMIEKEDYQTFVWIRDNLGKDYPLALLDPWKATAFTAITQKHILHRIFLQGEPVDDTIYQFLQDGCPSTAFLKDNGISVVYSQWPCNNPDLKEVKKNIYVTSPEILQLLQSPRAIQNGSFEAISNGPPKWWYSWSRNCTPVFHYPAPGREWGFCVGITVFNVEESEPWPVALWTSQYVPVEPGKAYYISGWLRTENIVGKGGARIAIDWLTSANTRISTVEFMSHVKGTKEWTFYEGVVTAPPDATKSVATCSLLYCTGTAWFDDIIFEQEQKSP